MIKPDKNEKSCCSESLGCFYKVFRYIRDVDGKPQISMRMTLAQKEHSDAAGVHSSLLYSRPQTLMLTYAILKLHLVVLSRDLCPTGNVPLVLLCKIKDFILCAVFVGSEKIFMTMFIPRSGTSLVFVADTLSPVLEQRWVHVHLLFL